MNIEELITKYLTNESSADENAALLDWVISDESNKKEFIIACQVWHNSALAQTSFDKNKAYSNFIAAKESTHTTLKPKVIELWKKVSAVAAIVVLTIGMFFLFKESKPNQITVANTNQTIKTVILPDGSQISLHVGSQISYPEKFEESSRKINVTGTVFCNVIHKETAPFVISTNQLQVQVLGTSFEVDANAINSHVIVETGRVKVTENSSNKTCFIAKGERADVTANSIVKTINNDVNFLSWKTGLLYFNNTPLQVVFSDLERHYNCKFNIVNKSILQEKITGTYQDFSLTDLISIINSAFPTLKFTEISKSNYEVSLQ
jgi:transmembrane sensor